MLRTLARSFQRSPNSTAIASNTTATPNTIGRVPIHWMRKNPVRNTPRIDPAVEIA